MKYLFCRCARPYGNIYEDIGEIRIFLKGSSFDTAGHVDFRPDIIHCHDWQTGLVPVYLEGSVPATSEFYRGIKSVMTIHNLKFQGVWDMKTVQEYYRTSGLLFHTG